MGAARRILVHRDERRHAAALGVGATHEVTRALGGDHDHVDGLRRADALEADVEAVRERQGLALAHRRFDELVVRCLLLGVGHREHDHVGPLGGGGDVHHLEAGGLGLGGRLAAVAQADDDLHTRLLQVQRVRVTLRAVADDGDLAAPNDRRICVRLVVHLCGHVSQPFVVVSSRVVRHGTQWCTRRVLHARMCPGTEQHSGETIWQRHAGVPNDRAWAEPLDRCAEAQRCHIRRATLQNRRVCRGCRRG